LRRRLERLGEIHVRHNRAFAAAGVLGTAILVSTLFGGAVGFGATAPATPRVGGVVNVFAESNGSKPGRVVLIGAIGDSGTTTNVNANGKVDAKGDYIKLTLKAGTISANLTALYQLLGSATPSFTSATCSASFAATSPAPLTGATGAYRGISGSVTLTFTVAVVLPRYSSGTKKGQCNLSGDPTGEQAIVTGAGTVAFSG
jgi:hypothetical protein